MREITLDIAPGTYVVAVSGGVDSVVLLNLLQQLPDLSLTVAHFDHGIRNDSSNDRHFVQQLARTYGLPFVYEDGRLGSGVSEAAAREVRIAFLRRVKQEMHAQAIIMAHHEDDLLETAILNLLRGTGRKGLSSLRSTPDVRRPLLAISKKDVINYATRHGLEWHEDSTNASTVYTRNYIRHKLMPRFDDHARVQLRKLIDATADTNDLIDAMLANILALQPSSGTLNRHNLIQLPHAISKELIAAWLRANGVRGFDKKTIEQVTVAMKTYAPGKQIDVDSQLIIRVEKAILALTSRER